MGVGFGVEVVEVVGLVIEVVFGLLVVVGIGVVEVVVGLLVVVGGTVVVDCGCTLKFTLSP